MLSLQWTLVAQTTISGETIDMRVAVEDDVSITIGPDVTVVGGGDLSLDIDTRIYVFGPFHVLDSGRVIVEELSGTGVKNEDSIFDSFNVEAGYPNPFSTNATIAYSLVDSEQVEVKVFNALGQEVKHLFSGQRERGVHQTVWDGTLESGQMANSGIYFVRIQVNDQQETRKLILVR